MAKPKPQPEVKKNLVNSEFDSVDHAASIETQEIGSKIETSVNLLVDESSKKETNSQPSELRKFDKFKK